MEILRLFGDHLGSIFYRRPYYRMMGEIVSEHRSVRHRRLYALDWAILLYAHRALWLAYVLHTDYAPIRGEHFDATLRNDVVLRYTYANRGTYNAFIFVSLYLFAVMHLFSETTIWMLDTRSLTWRTWYEVVVVYQDAYQAFRAEEIAKRRSELELGFSDPSGPSTCMFAPSVAKSVYCSIAVRVRLWCTLSNVDLRRLFAGDDERAPTAIMRKLSPQVRHSAIVFLVFADYVAFIVQTLFVAAPILMAISFTLIEDIQYYTTLALIWVLFDLYICHYIGQCLIRLDVFIICCSILSTIIHARHLIEICDRVRACIWRHRFNHLLHYDLVKVNAACIDSSMDRCANFARRTKAALLFRKKYIPTITLLLTEHNKVAYLVRQNNQQFFGQVLFVILLGNLPINLYIVQRITFQTLTSIDLIVMWMICFMELFTAITVIGPMARCCGAFHFPKQFIPALQAILCTPKWLPCKLKYDDLFGRLISGPKMGMSIGPIEAITYKIAFEFVLIYAAYIMMSFTRKIETDLRLAEISE